MSFFIKNFYLVLMVCICLAPFPGGRALAQPKNNDNIIFLAPGTPSSIPLIMAVEGFENVRLKIFHNHSQAHALFLRDKAQLLSTGLSVGINFFRKKMPVKIINSHVAGLSYLVSTRPVKGFGELAGKKIWLPFPGSPLEEMSRFFAKCEGLTLKIDIPVGYAMFDTSVKMLQQGRTEFAPLPEPFVTLAQRDSSLFITLDFAQLWEQYTGKGNPCPQVGTLANADWAANNKKFILAFNQALNQAILLCINNPDLAVKKTEPILGFSGDILGEALKRTRFQLLTDQKLKDGVFAYYNTIGSPLDRSFEDFF